MLVGMTWKWMGLAAGAACVMGASTPTVAHACSPPIGSGGCVENIDVFPDVLVRPTNACIVASWSIEAPPPGAVLDAAILLDAPSIDGGVPDQPDGGTRDFVYVSPDGEEIALSPGGGLRCPTRELDPATEYVIVGPTRCTGAPREYARFTTTDGSDTTPPTTPGEVVSTCRTEVCADGACCGPYTAVYVHSSWEPSSDDSGVVLYATSAGLRRSAGSETAVVTSGSVMFGRLINGSGSGFVSPGSPPTSVVAVDIAGNASEPGPTSASCVPVPDAGLGSDMDAGVEGSRSGSCSLHARTNDEGPSIVIAGLALLGVIARRRRR